MLFRSFGLVFVVSGLAFKLGVVPFHMWIPDVYHGAATPVTLVISSGPKIAAFAMVVRTDKAVEEGGSILQKVSQPAPKPAPVTTPVTPQPSTHNPLPTGQQTQPPASQAPANPQPPAATSKPAQTPPASSSAPASSKPAEQTPTSPPSAPAPTKKP